MLTVDSLKSFGANTEEGLARCMNNEAFYIRLVGMALKDAGYDSLKAALEKNDLDAAFEAAHGLKGILANLSLTPLLQPASEMTELLRARTPMDYTPYLEELLKQRQALSELAE